ncbi:MAG: addiction module antitoxin [Parcubacteria group bacterium Gr01-1014_29]|nr:MAG: addiction module antitoxin [Parcubacteria group bacterium Gr01-1014_29]
MQILFSKRARSDWQKLDTAVQERLREKLAYFVSQRNPLHYAEKIYDKDLGGFRFRVGYYRIVFDTEENSILVLRVGHRKDIYKK